jgi:(heptosyl)LPS beta-1,4-glucosyltransferase
MTGKISVVINTLNEERMLPFALRSVRTWADEIVVVDMHSEDRTVEIAREYGAKVFFHERTGFVEPARSYAFAMATVDWVLWLDADELVPEPLSRRLKDISDHDQADVVVVPRLNYLLGVPVMHTGWGPEQDKHARFFRRGMLRSSAKIHGLLQPVSGAKTLELAYAPGLAVVHFNYLDSSQFVEKLNSYTTIEAQQALERGEKASVWWTLCRAAVEFLHRYMRQQGYRDGWRGLYLAGLTAMYRCVSSAKLQELESVGGRNAILDSYRHEAEQVIAGYGEGRA